MPPDIIMRIPARLSCEPPHRFTHDTADMMSPRIITDSPSEVGLSTNKICATKAVTIMPHGSNKLIVMSQLLLRFITRIAAGLWRSDETPEARDSARRWHRNWRLRNNPLRVYGGRARKRGRSEILLDSYVSDRSPTSRRLGPHGIPIPGGRLSGFFV